MIKPFLRMTLLSVSILALAACSDSDKASNNSSTDTPDNNGTETINQAPTVSNIRITDVNGGKVAVGDTLVAAYTYQDADNDPEGASIYSWLRSDQLVDAANRMSAKTTLTFSPIAGANAISYTVTKDDIGKMLKFQVTPVAKTGTVQGTATVVDPTAEPASTGIITTIVATDNTDNGNTDNGNTDNGNTDNGNTDNGNTDNGNTDNTNYPPIISSTNTFSVLENGFVVGVIKATDPENSTLTYSLVGGADKDMFTVHAQSGELSFKKAPDFEAPSDTDQDNVYEVSVQVSDGTNVVQQTIKVTVEDIDESIEEPTTELQFYSDWPAIQSAIPKDPTLENQIASILAQMTLEEKVGQMIQPNLDQVTPAEAKQYKLGSLLNGGGSWPNNHKQAPASEWVSKADEYWTALEEAYQDRGFRIPFMWATDAVHGHNNVFGATVFPHNIGLGAANDPDLIYRIGQATAKEVAATGLDWTFAPTVAAPRDYRWGRTYEGYSEDPAIIYSYAGKMVEGLQGGAAGLKTDQHVISNVKHWLGDGGTLKGVDRGVNQYSESYLINLHATGYFSGLNAGAQVVMSSFNSWDNDANYDQTTTGTYNKKIHGSKYLINDVLKQKMGFDGLVVTDWNGQGEVNGCSAANCPAAVNAGNDIFMVTAKTDWKAFYTNVIAQVNDGTIPLSRIDDAVTRILRVKMRAGLWEKPKPSGRSLAGDQTVLGATSHRALAREAVSKSLVLLKNKSNVLPLQPTQKIYLAGSAADNLQKQTGGWSLTWQGTENTLADFPGATTVKSALTAQIGSENIITDLDAADENTIALIAIGEDPYAEFVGDIKDHQTLGFASLKASYAADLAAIKAAKAKGLKVVTLFFSGRPMYVNEEINHSDAFVAAWLPGTEASGITDVLYAANGADFSGKLSFTWPNTKCSTTINREAPHIPSYVTPEFEQSLHGEHAPLFAYGYGLSYATGAGTADLDNLPLDARNYGCGQSQPDTGIATLPLEIYNRNAGGEFVMRISGANNGWAAIPVSTQVETDQGDVSTRPINYQGQYDAVNVRFDGEGQAQLYLQYADEQGQDQSSYLNAESTLQFDIRMIQQPTKAFTLAQHCVWPCLGQIKMNDHLPAVSTNWSTVKIPLQCFADEGMNFALMNTPLLFLTEGEAAFDLGNVRLVPKSVDPASDAPTCAELKGIVDDADPIDVGTVTDDKALAVGFRTTTATALSITTIGNGLNSASLHTSSNAYEGESSLLLRHTGADWGGIFGDFNPPLDLSAYDTIKIALAAPSALSYLELKFDDATKAALSKNLLSYPFTSDGIWKIYSVPLAEFVGVDMSQIVAMGFWHPKDALGSYLKADILIDDIHFTEAVDTGTVTDEKALAVGFRTSTATALGITGDGIALNSTTLHTSSLAYEGDASLLMRHNGADWGGMFGEFSPPLNLSAYTKIVLAMAAPAELAELQLKFEDTLGGAVEKNLVSYPSTSAGAWKIYSVPLSEFVGVDMSQIKAIGFWHPKKAGGGYLASDILIDDIHFE